MRYYAVFDTNVLVSSMLTKRNDTATELVIDSIYSGDIIPLYCNEILREYEEVLRRKKFPFTEESIQNILKMVRDFGLPVTPSPTGEIFTDMDDLIFYEVVMEKRNDNAYLITGNIRHFPVRSYIVTPLEMMEILRKQKNSPPVQGNE